MSSKSATQQEEAVVIVIFKVDVFIIMAASIKHEI